MILLFTMLCGIISLIIGVASLIHISNTKKQKITYGDGIDKHLVESGWNIHHGMVIKNGKLSAQSKKLNI